MADRMKDNSQDPTAAAPIRVYAVYVEMEDVAFVGDEVGWITGSIEAAGFKVGYVEGIA